MRHLNQRKQRSLPSATTTQATGKEIAAIIEKARHLVNKNNPSETPFFLVLDELAKTVRAAKVNDADFFKELYRQSSRNQGKINFIW